MREVPFYQIDAFAERPFEGNPAAVVLLQDWPDDDVLQQIAAENNLSETAFIVQERDVLRLRWFTPAAEVDLCGHATLASAFVLFTEKHWPEAQIAFQTRSGALLVERLDDGRLLMDFPATPIESIEVPAGISEAIGAQPQQAFSGPDLVLKFASESEVAALQPDFAALRNFAYRGIVVTAQGEKVDFVSRFFAPAVGINEDPVTGSAHCALAPLWATEFGRSLLQARQISQRGGNIICEVAGERVRLTGSAVKVISGQFALPLRQNA